MSVLDKFLALVRRVGGESVWVKCWPADRGGKELWAIQGFHEGRPFLTVSGDTFEEAVGQTDEALRLEYEPGITARDQLFIWAYSSIIELAKAELMAEIAEGHRPPTHTWATLGQGSKETYLRRARDKAGINHDDFLRVVRGAELSDKATEIVDHLFDKGELPAPKPQTEAEAQTDGQ